MATVRPKPLHRTASIVSQPTLRNFAEVAHLIADADLLLFRRPGGLSGWISRAISIAGRSVYSHAAIAARFRCGECKHASRDVLLCCEVREFKGGRLVTLDSQVKKFPGRIDVYHTNARQPINGLPRPPRWPKFDAAGAVALMIRKAGQPYGWLAIWHAAWNHIPFVRWFAKLPDTNDLDRNGHPEFCSEAVSDAMRRGGGVDPVNQLADAYTEPGDLARSQLFEYVFTLRA